MEMLQSLKSWKQAKNVDMLNSESLIIIVLIYLYGNAARFTLSCDLISLKNNILK